MNLGVNEIGISDVGQSSQIDIKEELNQEGVGILYGFESMGCTHGYYSDALQGIFEVSKYFNIGDACITVESN